MEIAPLQLLKPMEVPLLQAAGNPTASAATMAAGPVELSMISGTKASASSPAVDFQKTMMEGLTQVNDSQNEAMQKVSDFLEGKGPALHAVMLSMEQANMNLEFAVQLRNKVMDAYSEIMRTQI
jgi:flagellar hook-basal body complex protein FliE